MRRKVVRALMLCGAIAALAGSAGCDYSSSDEREIIRGKVRLGDSVQEVTYERVNGVNYFQEDIIIPDGDIVKDSDDLDSLQRGIVYVNSSRVWTNKTINYVINASLPDKQRVYDAIVRIRNSTSLNFVESPAANYIEFVPVAGDNSSSPVGMIGGRQELKVSGGATYGIVMHEICHALGLMHEHSRSDRDNYVRVITANIQPGMEYNFDKLTGSSYQDVNSFSFESIMLYFSTALSSNGGYTLTKLDGSPVPYQRSYLASSDIAAINYLYPSEAPFSNVQRQDFQLPKYGPGYPYTVVSYSRKVADFNGDGRSDLLWIPSMSGYSSYVGFGQAAGNFAIQAIAPALNTTSPVFVGDINGDGKSDIIADTPYNTCSIYLSLGSGQFQLKSVPKPNQGPYIVFKLIAVGEFNADQYSDVVYQSGSTLMLGKGSSSGAVSYISSIVNNLNSFSDLIVSDLNNDGIDDLLVVQFNQTYGPPIYKVQTIRTLANGTFVRPANAQMQVTGFAMRFITGDVNADGFKDLVFYTSGNSSAYQVSFGNSQGTFSPSSTRSYSVAVPYPTQEIVVGNLPGYTGNVLIHMGVRTSELMSVVAAWDGAKMSVYRKSRISLPVSVAAGNVGFEAGDINGDRRTDLIVDMAFNYGKLLMANHF